MHHIVPRCYGGKDDASNLIRLTARQHFVAHHMLWKAYGGSMARAFFMMSNFGKYGVVNSRTYEAARSEYAAEVSAQFLGKKLGSPSEETRKKQAQAKLGRNGYGLIVTGISMSPKFEPEDRIYVNPDFQAQP